jgi:hypothetical protein
VTRRQRIDMTLLLIVRRAERDARLGSRPRLEAPDAPTASDATPHPSEAPSPQSS